MKTEIVLDEKAVAKVMRDPEVAIRIKDAVVKDVAKQVTEDVYPEVKKRILDDVGTVIRTMIRDGAVSTLESSRDESVVRLTTKAREELKKAVDGAFMAHAENAVFKRILEQEDRLRKRVDEIMGQMSKKRLADIVKYRAADFVETAMRKGLGCKA